MLPVITVLAGLGIVVGLLGIVVPMLPGVLLVWVSVLIWALAAQNSIGWVVVAVATAVTGLGWVLQYVIPGKRLKQAGVPNRTSVIGLVAGIAGFFVIPVVGLPLGFVGGVYLAESARVGPQRAWPSTVHAMKAALVSYGIEVITGLFVATAWIVGVWRLASA